MDGGRPSPDQHVDRWDRHHARCRCHVRADGQQAPALPEAAGAHDGELVGHRGCQRQEGAEGQGLEAYRRLCFRFDPATAGRKRNIVSSLLNPEKVKLDDLGTAIETWGEKIRAYEQRRGPDGERKEIEDDIKSGALQSMCPDTLQTHLSMNTSNSAYTTAFENPQFHNEICAWFGGARFSRFKFVSFFSKFFIVLMYHNIDILTLSLYT